MSAPHLLLVDDSDAILSLERAALADYALSTASDGEEALEKATRLLPALVVLDLSMPRVDGDEVLRRMRAHPKLSRVPVIVVSTEVQRAEECRRLGAQDFVPKPIRTDVLRAAVERALEEDFARRREDHRAILRVHAGPVVIALPLDAVRLVCLQPRTQPLPGAPHYASAFVCLRGIAVPVIDVCARFGLEHRTPLEDRWLVVVETSTGELALSVDRVEHPEECRTEAARAGEGFPIGEAIAGWAHAPAGIVPLVAPETIVASSLLPHVRALAAAARISRETA